MRFKWLLSMTKINYIKLEDIDAEELITLLNKAKIREHLIGHDLFDLKSISLWIQEKSKMNSIDGCRVRGVVVNNSIAGWCGIQIEEGKYEVAIVLDDKFWGLGKRVFNDILLWAKQFGHSEVFIHFLHTRPEYKFLRKISKNVFETEMLGNKFKTYQIPIL